MQRCEFARRRPDPFTQVNQVYRFIVCRVNDKIRVELVPFDLDGGASFAGGVFLEAAALDGLHFVPVVIAANLVENEGLEAAK